MYSAIRADNKHAILRRADKAGIKSHEKGKVHMLWTQPHRAESRLTTFASDV